MGFMFLVINPGSTSTKVALYDDTKEIATESLSHSVAELEKFNGIMDQLEYRTEAVKRFLQAQNMVSAKLSAVVGRGGLLRPIPGGTYKVNEKMLADLKAGTYGLHASNLGGVIADAIAKDANLPAFVVDPVVVDELAPIARITGRPEAPKRSIFHALNQKAVAKRYAASIQRSYEDLNLIVAHLGGGISVGCHQHGQVVEVNNALDGDGPFSPERAGTVQVAAFVEYVVKNGLSKDKVAKLLAGQGGLVAHLGTQDAREIEKRIQAGDQQAALIYDAMIYQIARGIGAAAVPVRGKVDAILLTGGIAYSRYVTDQITSYVEFLAPVVVIPGENEMQALAEGAYRVMSGQEESREY